MSEQPIRWSCYIDIEGFSELYKNDRNAALLALRGLTDALYNIGAKVFPDEQNRLFIHQFGDGFVILSGFLCWEKNPNRLVAICLALMRHLMKQGIVTKAGVSTGDFADITGVHTRSVINACDEVNQNTIRIGSGIMTIIPVMGSALINPYKLCGRKKGAVLLIETNRNLVEEMDEDIKFSPEGTIDWIHTDLPQASEICDKAGLYYNETHNLEMQMRAYIEKHKNQLSSCWISSTLKANGLSTK